MIEFYTEYISYWCISKGIIKEDAYNNFSYYLEMILTLLLNIILLVPISIFLNTWKELIVITIVFNCLRKYTGGFHASNLDSCAIISFIFITLICIVSKWTYNYVNYITFLSMIMGIYVIKNIPKIKQSERKKGNKYYRNKYIDLFLFFYIINFVSILIGLNWIANSISWTIILISLITINLWERVLKWIDKRFTT